MRPKFRSFIMIVLHVLVSPSSCSLTFGVLFQFFFYFLYLLCYRFGVADVTSIDERRFIAWSIYTFTLRCDAIYLLHLIFQCVCVSAVDHSYTLSCPHYGRFFLYCCRFFSLPFHWSITTETDDCVTYINTHWFGWIGTRVNNYIIIFFISFYSLKFTERHTHQSLHIVLLCYSLNISSRTFYIFFWSSMISCVRLPSITFFKFYHTNKCF